MPLPADAHAYRTCRRNQVHLLTGDVDMTSLNIDLPLISLIVVYRNMNDLSPVQYNVRVVADICCHKAKSFMHWPVFNPSLASRRRFSYNSGRRPILANEDLCIVFWLVFIARECDFNPSHLNAKPRHHDHMVFTQNVVRIKALRNRHVLFFSLHTARCSRNLNTTGLNTL